ncbi:related to high-affinity phosphate permease, phosphate-repressible [Cephalotrichum gorgonifer]|uniref:Related to high-affinity phosphate permease, phosphate-repressible n=1 Tax=Cephalotrichum gorgonifer TaxID=2041049 RepID=A0AAE8MRN9_9PEZI|nr:related to high-affinity phosphate permease, phosphate-repressible [Cephalotrichum gorgonifer]
MPDVGVQVESIGLTCDCALFRRPSEEGAKDDDEEDPAMLPVARPTSFRHPGGDRRQLRYELDLNSWNLRIWGVAASGFLTDSFVLTPIISGVTGGLAPANCAPYNLFSTNVILASIAFVYWPDGGRWHGLVINLCTLVGSVIGQLLFGFLADYYGRTRLYGIELILVIVSTIGVATSSYGYQDLSFLALFCWWRFVMGVGIGGEYPLSAVITSEWASSRSRGRMLSSVFMMQPIGQALAQLVGLWVLLGRENMFGLKAMQCGLNTKYDEECRKAVDGIWRIVIGCGAVPAVLAIIFRFFLFDSGIYSLEVRNKAGAALRNTQKVYGAPTEGQDVFPMGGNGVLNRSRESTSPRPMPIQFTKADMYRFFIQEGNWYYLLGTSATWFFLDVSFYGLSLDNRGTLSDMWATSPSVELNESLACWNSSLPGGESMLPRWKLNGLPIWQTDSTLPCNTIYDVLVEQAYQYLLTVSVASIAGSACFVIFVNRLPRRLWLTVSFFVLFIVFIVTGGVYYAVNKGPASPATLAFVALCHFLFNFGANTLTFIIPAEIFPTCYRATCHGISAAMGKIGSIVAVLIVTAINMSYTDETRQGLIFILFGSFVLLGAIFSWAYLPDSERWVVEEGGGRYLEPKTLEDLGEGREKARLAGEVLTVQGKWGELVRRRREKAIERRGSDDA